MIEEIKALDVQFQEKTGRPAFGYVSAPTPTSERWTFQDGSVFTKGPQAYAYMLGLLRMAETSPEQLPYPLKQPLSDRQDARQ